MSMIKIMLDSFGIDATELQATAKQLQEFYNTVQRVEKKLDFVIEKMGYNVNDILPKNDHNDPEQEEK